MNVKKGNGRHGATPVASPTSPKIGSRRRVKEGEGIVAAVAIETDNRTGDTTRYLLTPSGGVPATAIATVVPVDIPLPDPDVTRRRAARRCDRRT
ncbi:MAG TPA: hypothetical protein VM534_05740 [Thermoanaerobaculia bacterium]|nr:hypothetical protein [Thermoanaerobaculia bacterium]